MKFQFTSKIYQYFLWIALCGVLALDTINLVYLFISSQSLSTFMLIFALLGYALKFSILIILIRCSGPINTLVYIWGGLMILSGVSGFLSLLTAMEVQPIQLYFNHTIMLAFGLALVIPINKSVQIQENA